MRRRSYSPIWGLSLYKAPKARKQVTDEDGQVACRHCGRKLNPRGVKTHERYCPENPDNVDVRNDASPDRE